MHNRDVIKYAQAVFDVSSKSNLVLDTSKRLNNLLFIFNSCSELRLFLFSRRIQIPKKIEILKNVFNKNLTVLELDLVENLLENGNISLLSLIIKRFNYLYDNTESSFKVTVSLAEQLSSDELSEIINGVEKMLDKKIEANVEIQPEIIGGMKLRIGNKIIDGSISTRLKKLENSLFQG